MNTDLFNTAFSEAYRSGTGRDFEDPDIQQAFAEFSEQTETKILAAWTTPPNHLETPDKDTKDEPGVDRFNQVITHPARGEFNQADLDLAVRMRFFGRSLIDCAKLAILTNDNFDTRNKFEAVNSVFTMLRGDEWYTHHPDDPWLPGNNQNPDEASPLRLTDWPRGDYLNCLGISIGGVAACEISGMDYIYGSELRYAQSLINEGHQEFKEAVEKLEPGFFEDPTIQEIFQNIDVASGIAEIYADILFNTPDILEQDHQEPRDFHHYAVARYGQPDGWLQLDPYGLVAAMINDTREKPASATLTKLATEGDPAQVILHDASELLNDALGKYHKAIAACRDWEERFDKGYTQEQYKSAKFMKEMYWYTHFAGDTITGVLFDSPDDDEDHRDYLKASAGSHAYITWMATVTTLLDKLVSKEGDSAKATYTKLIEDHVRLGLRADPALDKFTHESEKVLHKAVQDDSNKRALLMKYVRLTPLIFLAHTYRNFLANDLDVRILGSPNLTAEFAEPEFMIGAMYLNHYATWRKDGRINVAQHLARLSPSQLLWQAAQQDGRVEDERVQAVGLVIQDLKPRQLHPLVNIARSIRPVKGNAHAPRDEAGSGSSKNH